MRCRNAASKSGWFSSGSGVCGAAATHFYAIVGGGTFIACPRCWIRYEASVKEQVELRTLEAVTEAEAERIQRELEEDTAVERIMTS